MYLSVKHFLGHPQLVSAYLMDLWPTFSLEANSVPGLQKSGIFTYYPLIIHGTLPKKNLLPANTFSFSNAYAPQLAIIED